MGRSRMFGDDDPEDQKNGSPRTTIVGGRPPERQTDLPPVPTGIQKLLRLASVDESFAHELTTRRADVASAAGVELSARERAILTAIDAGQLAQMIHLLPPPPANRFAFLRQTASTAVVLLGGAALASCTPSSQPQEIPAPGFIDAGTDASSSPVQTSPIDTTAEPPPPRPNEIPPPPGGALSDMPPERPDHRPMETEGGAAPSEPPPARPQDTHPTRGIRPDGF